MPAKPGAAPAADNFLGKTVAGRFELESVLGEGGMGKVYLAKDRETGQPAAVKVLLGKLSGNEEYVQRLKQEARTGGRLRHDGAVRILASGEAESGEPFLAMEYCPGKSLKEIIEGEGHLAIGRAANIASQILSVVAAAHRQGIIHRDLKPENIKIAPDPLRGDGVKVLDFGVAKFIGGEGVPEMENVVKTKTGIILGTPKYMAPEQIRGEQVDGRADIYSVGAILYEMLSGDPPFQADDVFGYVTKHLKEAPIRLTERVPEYAIPKELDALVILLLEKNPANRPKDASEIEGRLRRFSSGTGAARTIYAARVAAAWVVPGVAAAIVIRRLAEAPEWGLVSRHGTWAAIGLAVGGAVGTLLQPRLSVMGFVKRLLIVGLLVGAAQGVAAARGGTGWAAAGYALASLLVFSCFSLAWPMAGRWPRFLWAGLVAPATAALTIAVPKLVPATEGGTDFYEVYYRAWSPQVGLTSPPVLAVLALGVCFGIGVLFLPRPGRGTTG